MNRLYNYTLFCLLGMMPAYASASSDVCGQAKQVVERYLALEAKGATLYIDPQVKKLMAHSGNGLASDKYFIIDKLPIIQSCDYKNNEALVTVVYEDSQSVGEVSCDQHPQEKITPITPPRQTIASLHLRSVAGEFKIIEGSVALPRVSEEVSSNWLDSICDI